MKTNKRRPGLHPGPVTAGEMEAPDAARPRIRPFLPAVLVDDLALPARADPLRSQPPPGSPNRQGPHDGVLAVDPRAPRGRITQPELPELTDALLSRELNEPPLPRQRHDLVIPLRRPIRPDASPRVDSTLPRGFADRRRAPRVPCRYPVRLSDGTDVSTGEIVNISMTGLLIDAKTLPAVGAVVTGALCPGDPTPGPAVGFRGRTVRWAEHPDGARAAIVFTRMGPRHRQRLEQLVDTVRNWIHRQSFDGSKDPSLGAERRRDPTASRGFAQDRGAARDRRPTRPGVGPIRRGSSRR